VRDGSHRRTLLFVGGGERWAPGVAGGNSRRREPQERDLFDITPGAPKRVLKNLGVNWQAFFGGRRGNVGWDSLEEGII
jgi:hypothetical protein